VFLDELHHLSLESQAQLLRAIQEKKIRRVGATQEIEVNFRLIAATKPDIEKRVKAGTFMEDLYFRLRFHTITVPPLRERPEDIEPLVAHFCRKYFEETGQKKTFLMRTIRLLEGYEWPGNVRDLEGYVFSLLTESPRPTIDPKQLDHRFFRDESNSALPLTLDELERRHERERRERIVSTLAVSRSVAHAAEKLGVKPTTLHSMMGRLGIKQNVADSAAL
jgi:DNA-binding NtrC family response regulator